MGVCAEPPPHTPIGYSLFLIVRQLTLWVCRQTHKCSSYSTAQIRWWMLFGAAKKSKGSPTLIRSRSLS